MSASDTRRQKASTMSDNRLSSVAEQTTTARRASSSSDDSRRECRIEEEEEMRSGHSDDDDRRLHCCTCTTRLSLACQSASNLLPQSGDSPTDACRDLSPCSRLPQQLRCGDTRPVVGPCGTADSSVTTRTHATPSTGTGFRPRRLPAHRLSPSRKHCHTRRRSIYWSLCHSPRNPLLTVVVLLVIGLLPNRTAMARPAAPKWSNPCGVDLKSFEAGGRVDERGSAAREAYANIVSAAEAAEEHTNHTKTQFVAETFGDPEFMKEFEWLSYDWLPKIEDPTEGHLGKLKIVSSLNDSFNYLQYFAMAIDQLILDQLVYEGNFLGKFRRMETDLATVLCQIQTAMLKLQKLPDASVTKKVMNEEELTVESETTRNVRDFIILRDYQKTLSYIAKVFKHFLDRTDPSVAGSSSSSA